jgi:midasin (ATPase involved in ribosome maturation)
MKNPDDRDPWTEIDAHLRDLRRRTKLATDELLMSLVPNLRCVLMPTMQTGLTADFETAWQTSEWWQWPTYSLKRGAIVL